MYLYDSIFVGFSHISGVWTNLLILVKICGSSYRLIAFSLREGVKKINFFRQSVKNIQHSLKTFFFIKTIFLYILRVEVLIIYFKGEKKSFFYPLPKFCLAVEEVLLEGGPAFVPADVWQRQHSKEKCFFCHVVSNSELSLSAGETCV